MLFGPAIEATGGCGGWHSETAPSRRNLTATAHTTPDRTSSRQRQPVQNKALHLWGSRRKSISRLALRTPSPAEPRNAISHLISHYRQNDPSGRHSADGSNLLTAPRRRCDQHHLLWQSGGFDDCPAQPVVSCCKKRVKPQLAPGYSAIQADHVDRCRTPIDPKKPSNPLTTVG
jgi:hypothetical protein